MYKACLRLRRVRGVKPGRKESVPGAGDFRDSAPVLGTGAAHKRPRRLRRKRMSALLSLVSQKSRPSLVEPLSPFIPSTSPSHPSRAPIIPSPSPYPSHYSESHPLGRLLPSPFGCASWGAVDVAPTLELGLPPCRHAAVETRETPKKGGASSFFKPPPLFRMS